MMRYRCIDVLAVILTTAAAHLVLGARREPLHEVAYMASLQRDVPLHTQNDTDVPYHGSSVSQSSP